VRSCDKKVAEGKERVAIENAPKELTAEEQAKLNEMDAQVSELVRKATELAEAGDIDGSEEATRASEDLKARREEEHRMLTTKGGRGRGVLEVCEISAVYMNSADNESRKQDHYNGKQVRPRWAPG